MMKTKIDNWLRDKQRKYAIGLAIFMALATQDMKNRYAHFLNEGEKDDVSPNDPRFPILINRVTFIYNMVKANPEAYKDKDISFALPELQVKDQVKQIIALKQQTDELNTRIDELKEADDDKSAEIDQLQDEIEEKDTEIGELKAKLKEKGIKVLTGQDLPAGTKKKYDRIKVIVPLMAAIHGELKNTSLTDDERKVKAEELCKLDDEKRKLWDEIDEYLNDYNTELAEEKENEYSEDPLIRGAQMAYRVIRLKENIKRNTDSAARHKENGKPEQEQKALEKAAKMQSELEGLEAILNEKK
ncbi:MAG: hypothetical protein LBS20_10910 [Prevotella sp.]|jgi:hypothetical protein|nr:hypothetical protein [Prevotella sp.]